jgi:hypothetical protein
LSNATVLLLDDAGATVATQTLGDTCKQLELELSDFIPWRDPDDYSYNPTSFPTIFPTSSPTRKPTLTSKTGKNSKSTKAGNIVKM